jgi:hypothetical protein
MRNQRSRNFGVGRFLLGLGAVVWVPAASAQTAECIPMVSDDPDGDGITFEHITSAGRRDLRVSTTNLDALGLSSTTVIRAVGLAGAIWSEQAGGRPIRYQTNTTLTDLPTSLADCEEDGTTYSIVVVDPGQDPGGGTNTAKIGMRCIDMFSPTVGLAWAFKLTIYARDLNNNLNSWVSGASTIAAGQQDLVGTLVHELGHSYSIMHHSEVDAGQTETQFSVMGYNVASTRRRDLYWRDIMCVTNQARSSTLYRRAIDNGVVGNESLFDQGFTDRGWAKASAGVRFTSMNGVSDWAHAAEASGCTRWAPGAPFSNARCLPSSNDIHTFTEAVWRERTPTNSRVIWSDFNEYVGTTQSNGARLSVHRVRQRRSSDGFANGTTSFLDECSSMTGFMTCTNTTPVVSPFQAATAWHDGLSRTVTAWANHSRNNDTNSHAIRISVGSTGESVLPVADRLTFPPGGANVQSNVGPGLACRDNQANGFDCIIAVVRQDDALGRITVYRFSVAQDNARNRFAITIDPNSTLLAGERTGNRIAAWHHNGRFWLAYRSLNAGQGLMIRSSADSVTWTGDGPGTAIDAGPSAASYFAGNNHLLYVHD